MRKDIFGWFDSGNAEVPAHDPGLGTICLICGEGLRNPIKTISLMKDGDDKSYFYRTHKYCYENLSSDEVCKLESSLIDQPNKKEGIDKEEETPGSLTEKQFYKIKDLILACYERNTKPEDCFNICVSQKLCREEKDNTVTEGKWHCKKCNYEGMEVICPNCESTHWIKKQPSEPSTIPVVDYKKEAIDKAAEIYPLHNGNSRGEDNEQINLRTAYANGYVAARQMSSPSDTNCKVKGLRKLLSDTWDTAMAKGFGVPGQQNKTDYLNSIQDTPDTI